MGPIGTAGAGATKRKRRLSAAAVCGLPPAGPERRQRVPLHLVRGLGPTITGPLCATDAGFSLHAATVAPRDDPRGRETLLKYVLRPPLAQQRLELLDDGLVRLTLKRAFSDGTTAIDLDPLSLLCRLAASVPAPGAQYGSLWWTATVRLAPSTSRRAPTNVAVDGDLGSSF